MQWREANRRRRKQPNTEALPPPPPPPPHTQKGQLRGGGLCLDRGGGTPPPPCLQVHFTASRSAVHVWPGQPPLRAPTARPPTARAPCVPRAAAYDDRVSQAGQSPEDWADLVEYCHGNASTAWGRQRIADGHPAPYDLTVFELGNEQYNPRFVEQVLRQSPPAPRPPPLPRPPCPSSGAVFVDELWRRLRRRI